MTNVHAFILLGIQWALLAFLLLSTPATAWYLRQYYQRRVLGIVPRKVRGEQKRTQGDGLCVFE